MIEVEHVAKAFKGARGARVEAVVDVSFVAGDGAITGLLGPNGAGKTTSLRALAALIDVDSGSLRIDGIDVSKQPRQALERLGWLSDSRGLSPRLTARENIVYYGQLRGLSQDAADARAVELSHLLELAPLLDRRVEGFSQGERMKTALARALVHDPPNIVLDEATNGLDVVSTRALREFLRWLRSPAGGGKCIVFCTHIMQEIERLCDEVVVMSRGRTVAQGTLAVLLDRTRCNDFESAFVALAFDQGQAA